MSTDPATPDALATALRQLLAPLARLALAQGVTHATLDELVKQALVDAADQAHAALPPHRRVSRITTATGIHRREVTRLVTALREGAARQPPPARSHASELFAHWRSQPAYRAPDGTPAVLPRQGPAPSFESLAQAITRDVHPRSLLDELLRLGLARLDAEADTVRLVRDGFVPVGDQARLLQVLGRNVGAHLAGAVDNLLLDAGVPGVSPQFEQAIFAGGLSDASLATFRQLVSAQWQATLQALVPVLEDLIARDAAAAADPPAAAAPHPPDQPAPPPARHQVRLGLYTHTRPHDPPAAPPPAAPPENTDEPDAAP